MKHRILTSGLAAGLLAAAACGAADGDSGVPSKAEFEAVCLETSNMGEALCDCVAGKAMSDYDADGRRFIYATLTQDTATIEALRTEMPTEQILEAGLFMVNAPQDCARSGPSSE
ncbi:MAG: hypothetical protein AAFQ67_04970 [Pseudomonadota bacterium]